MQQSALRLHVIVCDHDMETTLFAIVCDLRFAILDTLRSSAIVCDHMETSLNKNKRLKLFR